MKINEKIEKLLDQELYLEARKEMQADKQLDSCVRHMYQSLIFLGIGEFDYFEKNVQNNLDFESQSYYLYTWNMAMYYYQKEQYLKVVNILSKELELSYVPLKYESRYQKLYQASLSHIKVDEQYQQTINFENLVQSDVEHALPTLIKLRSVNITQYLEEIQALLKVANHVVKLLLIDILAEQNIDQEMTLVIEDESIVINPVSFSLMKQEFFTSAISFIANLELSQTIKDLYAETAMQIILELFPFDKSELDHICEHVLYFAHYILNIEYKIEKLDLQLFDQIKDLMM